MRTIEEIVTRCRKPQDFLGFDLEVLCPYLPAEQFKEFAKEDADLSDWQAKPLDALSVIADMKDYMEFAWGKVEDHRGISASRSVSKMQAWLWLLEDKETLYFAESDRNYQNYGAPILMKICQKYGFPFPDTEDIKRMSQGLPCHEGCNGCGH